MLSFLILRSLLSSDCILLLSDGESFGVGSEIANVCLFVHIISVD